MSDIGVGGIDSGESVNLVDHHMHPMLDTPVGIFIELVLRVHTAIWIVG